MHDTQRCHVGKSRQNLPQQPPNLIICEASSNRFSQSLLHLNSAFSFLYKSGEEVWTYFLNKLHLNIQDPPYHPIRSGARHD